MKAREFDPNRKAPLHRRIFGSALSAFVGWLTLNIWVLAWAFVTRAEHYSNPPMPNEWLTGPAFIAIYSAAFVFGTWICALVPLYLFVPLRSFLWRWPVCTLCGALAGALIFFPFFGLDPHDRGSSMMTALAALTGGATCLFGSLTARRFHDVSDSTHSQPPLFRP